MKSIKTENVKGKIGVLLKSGAISWLLFLLFTIPFVTTEYFTTLDGPGHIHNATVIRSLLSEGNGLFHRYFELNTFLSPNLLGHYLLLPVMFLVGEASTDRFMLVLCMLAQYAGLRYCLRSLKVPEPLALLPLCFLINTPLFSGFYSFSLGVGAMFWAVGFFIRHWDHFRIGDLSKGSVITLALLLVLVYLLHLVPAVLACLMIAIVFLGNVVRQRAHHTWRLAELWRFTLPVALAALPVAVLVVVYQLHDTETSNYVFMEPSELWRQWGVMQGLIINHRNEWAFTRWFWIIPGAAFVIDLLLRKFKPSRKENSERSHGAVVLCLSLLPLLMMLYFVMPDASSGGGALTVRLNYLLVIVSVLLPALCVRTRAMQIVMVAAMLMVLFDHRNNLLVYHEEHAFFMRDVNELNKTIEQPGVLLVHRFRYDWPFEHCTKYLGKNPRMIHVDALGGHKIYAPVKWKQPLRNHPDLVAMFDKGWHQDPQHWLRFFPGQRVYVLAIGKPEPADSTAWSNWQRYMHSKAAVENWSSDSVMHLYAFEQ